MKFDINVKLNKEQMDLIIKIIDETIKKHVRKEVKRQLK